MKFTDSADEKKVLQVVDGIAYHNSGTKTGNAIVAAGKLLFSQSREKVRKVRPDFSVLIEWGVTIKIMCQNMGKLLVSLS